MTRTFLDNILQHKRTPPRALPPPAPAPSRRDFPAAIGARPGIAIIAELKKASPSKGLIRPDFDPAAIARSYERAGAAALSVLTEPNYFAGDLAHLNAARDNCSLPILRKDFLTHPAELDESAAADAVLLIAAVLAPPRLKEMMSRARALGLDCLVEVHDEAELDAALATGAEIIGINNRDLRTFQVDLRTTHRLRPRIPSDRIVVSESGISQPDQLRALRDIGVHAALIGEAFMRSPDPGARLRELLSALKEST